MDTCNFDKSGSPRPIGPIWYIIGRNLFGDLASAVKVDERMLYLVLSTMFDTVIEFELDFGPFIIFNL